MASRTRISHYELLESIGRDGATEIYRARDRRLDRDVAVKLLRPEELSHRESVERFLREARIASLVTHPHICAVHDSGEEDGRPFLVCEFLEGRALDDVIAGSPQPPDRVLDVGIQVADALAAAHRRGIVHGNVKPSNVFITNDGHVKLLELGAALAAVPQPPVNDSGLGTTSVKIAIGPPAAAGEFFHPYIAPEQISGAGEPRSDVFATGALLYQMATGTAAFRGSTPAEIVAAITGQTPARPRSLNARVPKALEQIILRSLEKDPARRYPGAEELRDDLRRARRQLDAPSRLSRWLRQRRPASIAAAMLLVLALLAAAGVARSWWGGRPVAGSERSAILVGQIANGTGDPDFDGTLRQALTVYLGQSPYLDLASDERIRSALQMMGRDPETQMTHQVASDVCQRLGVQAMLEGSVSAVGASTVVALVASDCGTGVTIAREQVEVERKEDVLWALGRLTASMRKSLGESGATLARHNVPIQEATTSSMEALKVYTEAVARRSAGAESEAVKLLERAVTIDPRFALGYTTLSSIFGGFGETARSEQYARLAFEHRDRVSESERLFITSQYYDRVVGDQLKTREALEVWKATYPRDYRPANALALLLNRLGDYTQAAREATEAMRRNPAHAFPRSNLAYAYRGAGRFAEARATAEEAIARHLDTAPMRRLLYQVAELQGDAAAAQQQIDWAASAPRGFDITGARAQVAAFRGHIASARLLYGETRAGANARGFRQVASGYAAQAAVCEALYGFRTEAVSGAREVIRTETAYEPQLRAATALALAGAPDEAERLVRRLENLRPQDTLLHGAYLPVARAAVLIARGRFEAAVDELRRAATYERGTVAALMPSYLRGEAWLRAGSPREAAREFRAVLENRGADPFAAIVPLSQLGLARALARTGAREESRGAYEALLRTWATADPDIPVLRQARGEFARQVP